jgi:hypothetical protein
MIFGFMLSWHCLHLQNLEMRIRINLKENVRVNFNLKNFS